MIISQNLQEILNNFDFTDSIVSQISWENNLFDLVLTIHYYWDIQEGREQARVLKVRFKNSIKANFQITPKLLDIRDEELPSYSLSWYTIVCFKILENNDNNLIDVAIYTTDYSIPWLTITCKELLIEGEE